MVLVYLIFFFLILRFTVTLFNFISNPKLTYTPRKYHDLVSILIHVENGEHDVSKLFESISEQDYQNFEVIILDDQSYGVKNKSPFDYPFNDNRFRIIKSKKAPESWLKKNFASYQLAAVAKGDYFMFLQPDTTLAKGLINNAVHRMKINRLALLSLFPDQQMRSFGERLVVPLVNFVLLNFLPVRLIKLFKNPVFAAASEDFMLFDAKNYIESQWHKQVKRRTDEDIEIMRLIKDEGYSAEALLANGYITSRMYKNFREASEGFSRILLAGFNNNVFALLIYLLLVIFGPVYIAWYLDLELLFFAFSLIILSRIMVSLSSAQNPLINIILHPLQILSLLFISIWSIKWRIIKNNNSVNM
jgi:glycosyltransferase involved in cell wall biosynthesis